MNSDEESVGYKRPPRSTRFQKGRSGNPRGRPRNRRSEIPYDQVLGQMVTIREDGRERRVTAAEAFLLQLTKRGLEGDSSAARASLEAIEAARVRRGPSDGIDGIRIILVSHTIGCAMRTLGLAVKLHPLNQEKVRWELQPWLVQAAVERLGDRRLSADEQRVIVEVTRTPEKVNWPAWWSERQRER
jgi:Family of unknown function (DUF5681)